MLSAMSPFSYFGNKVLTMSDNSTDISHENSMLDTLNTFMTHCTAWSWEWESDRKTALRTIQGEEADAADKLLRSTLPYVYDYKNLDTAPINVVVYVEQCGGIRRNQRIYAAPCGDGLSLVVLWWPWSDGSTTSLRVGLAGNASDTSMTEFSTRFDG